MPYRAALSDICYRYDGSFAGLLCCVFESYARHELPAGVCSPEEGQLSLYGQRVIQTQTQQADRVYRGLVRCGAAAQEQFATGFLNTDPGKDAVLLRFARICFDYGGAAAQMLGDEDGAAAFALARAVNNEACLSKEFLRFEQRGELLGAVLHPRHRILPLLRAHFCDRLPDEKFLIFDATHGAALLREGDSVRYLRMDHWAPVQDAAELDWQALWKRFYHATTIEPRRNERCQRGHSPKHYWRDMVEHYPLAEDGRGRELPGAGRPARPLPAAGAAPGGSGDERKEKYPDGTGNNLSLRGEYGGLSAFL